MRYLGVLVGLFLIIVSLSVTGGWYIMNHFKHGNLYLLVGSFAVIGLCCVLDLLANHSIEN